MRGLLLIIGVLFIGCDGIYPVANLGVIGVGRKKDNSEMDDEQNRRLNDLGKKVLALEKIVDMQQDSISLLGLSFSNLQQVDDNLQSVLDSIILDLDNLEINLESELVVIDNTLNGLQTQITALQNAASVNVTEVIDPCGDGAGIDEVLLRLADNSIIAYFESGNKRRLSILPPGNYQTTDDQKCNFSVSSTGVIND